MQNPYNEVHIRDGICCSAEATPKGIRAAFRSYSRGGLESDEVTTAYECGLSGRGLHPANLQKMLTWVNCERDSVITGQQAEHYDDYSFLHRVHGQLRPIETTLIAGASCMASTLPLSCSVRAATLPSVVWEVARAVI